VGDKDKLSSEDRRASKDRRSGTGTRSDEEKQQVGERRSQPERRPDPVSQGPSNEQLALFSRRLRRAMNNEKAASFFGIANGENDFAFYPDVLRTAEWIQSLVSAEPDQPEHRARTGGADMCLLIAISLGESAWAARGCAVRVTDGENTELCRTPLDAIPIWAKTRGSA
jgi:hypothetical protein